MQRHAKVDNIRIKTYRSTETGLQEGYADAIAKWLTENNVPFKLSIKDGKEYVVCSDKKMLSAALGCQ